MPVLLYFEKREIEQMLQRYKPSLQKIMQRPLNLYMANHEIQIESFIPGGIDKPTTGKPKDFESMLKEGYSKELVDSIAIYSLVEEWMKILKSHEREVLFHRYINHDFEIKGKRYKCLSLRETAQKMNISKSSVENYEREAIKKIEIYNA
jgi:DNA-directed RNA polymerase sigma subunit (sigma70/sigma32)